MYWLAVLAAAFSTSSVFALGLGEIEGQPIIGRPLQLAIPVLGVQADTESGACVSLQPEGDEESQSAIRIKVEGGRIHLSTTQAVVQPILRFRISLGCASPFQRSFVVLSDPPGNSVASPSPQLPAIVAAVAERAVAVAERPASPAPSAGRNIVLASTTSLRMLSRQRFPVDANARVSFIRSLAAANPDLFTSEAAAFDQRLPAGTRLAMPAGRRARQRPDAVATAAGPRPDGGGRGRLIVGAAALPASRGPNTAELSESLDRLIEVMNQQVIVEIALTERIKTGEAELAELKHWASAERLRVAKLESDLKAVRETAERNGTIQLLLLVLLGGLGGAGALNWWSRRKAEATRSVLVAESPAPTFEPRSGTRSMPSAFDGLLDQRDDLLPPGSLR